MDEIARDLGIGRSTLSYWIRMAILTLPLISVPV
ncbi:hypothetical protein [Deinococcus fonticola]